MENKNIALAQEAAYADELTQPVPQKRKINRAKLQENIWGWIFKQIISTTPFLCICRIRERNINFRLPAFIIPLYCPVLLRCCRS